MLFEVARSAIRSARARSLLCVALLAACATASMQRGPGTQSFTPRFPPPINPPTAPPIPGTKPILQASDFTYVGAIRMTPESGVDTQFAYGGLAGRFVNG